MDGSREERILSRLFYQQGYMAMRAPASGSVDREAPDILTGSRGVGAVIELKSGDPPNNVKQQEVRDLEAWGRDMWFATLLGARYSGDRTFYLVPPAELDRTPSDHYSLPSDPDDLAWDIAIPWTRVDGSPVPTDVSVRGASGQAQDLGGYLLTLTQHQQGKRPAPQGHPARDPFRQGDDHKADTDIDD